MGSVRYPCERFSARVFRNGYERGIFFLGCRSGDDKKNSAAQTRAAGGAQRAVSASCLGGGRLHDRKHHHRGWRSFGQQCVTCFRRKAEKSGNHAMLQLAAIIASLVTAAIALAILLRMIAQSRFWHEERLLLEPIRGGQRSETETLRTVLLAGQESARRELVELLGGMRDSLGRNHAELVQALASGQERVWRLMDEKLAELRRSTDQKLAEIQQTVNEQLHQAVEQQMTASFSRVTEQFALVQKAMGDVQAVTAQISDIKRIFSNVRTRGGWGETQLRALMDDVLPSGSYETNKRLRQDSDAVVEFAVIMPMRGPERTYLPIDAKFPVEDYERLLAASERGDVEAERAAQAGLIRRIREEARRIQEKYIVPPTTVEFAVMYLPTDGLYVEVARVPGLIDEIGRNHRVLVLGPSLFPALLRTIHLGHITLALEQKADEVRVLLGATRTEMEKMDLILAKLGKQAGTLSNTIETARQRTRAVRRKLRDVEAVDAETAERLLGVEAEALIWRLRSRFVPVVKPHPPGRWQANSRLATGQTPTLDGAFTGRGLAFALLLAPCVESCSCFPSSDCNASTLDKA